MLLARRGDHIGDQLCAGHRFVSDHHGLTHGWHLQQARLDFTKLDAETANFYLMVEAPDVLDDAVGVVASQVAGAIEASALEAERVRHEALGGQIWSIEVTTRELVTGNHQFAHGTDGYGLATGIEQIHRAAGQRSADRDGFGQRRATADVVGAILQCRVDCGFGRAVDIEQAHVAKTGLAPGSDCLRWHRFAADNHLAQ